MLERDAEIFRSSLKKRLASQNGMPPSLEGKDLPQEKFQEFDAELAELKFKPLTQGLGFHQSSNLAKTGLISKRVLASSLPNNLAAGSSRPLVSNLTMPRANASQVQNLSPVERAQRERLQMNRAQVFDAPRSAQVLAFTFDLICIAFLLFITAWAFVRTSGVPAYRFLQMISLAELVLFTGTMFLTYYLLYFSILDLSVTPGKSLFDLKLARSDLKDLRLTQSFVRCFATLFSLCFLGIPLLFNVQGKLSKTKVTRTR